MRVSVKPSDPGFCAYAYNYEAYFNGICLKNCVTADEELGFVLCYKLNQDGRMIEDEKGYPVEEILYGDVKIISPG
jgi:hypothetical protein